MVVPGKKKKDDLPSKGKTSPGEYQRKGDRNSHESISR